jgi:hypothetical protein
MMKSMRRDAPRVALAWLSLVAVLICSVTEPGCGSSATAPSGPLANGRWTGDGACLAVTDGGCNLAVGCGHGQFPKPVVRADGTFDVDGTYRIEAGPVSIEPAPPAHFSGSVTGSSVTLTVVPTAASLQRATYVLRPSPPGACPIPCV